MRKISVLIGIVIFMVLASAPVAQAQYYRGQSEMDRAMGGGRQITGESFARIHEAMAREQARLAGRDMRDMGYDDPYARRQVGYDQYPMPNGSGYSDPCAVYAGQSIPNGTRPIVYGGVGAAAGRVASRDPRAMAVGGIIGAVVGSVKDSRDRRRAEQAYADCQATMAAQSSQRQVYETTRRESDRAAQQTALTVTNRVKVLVRVSVDGGDFIYIDPSDEISIPEPQDSVRAEFREVRSGRVSWKRAEVRENDRLDGFEVILPKQ